MKKPPRPSNEAQRQRVLESYGILDTAPEMVYDDIVALIAQICQTPMAGITLIDRDRQWFKAAPPHAPRELPRDVTFCSHAILTNELMMVADARLDDRFRDSPMVTGPSQIQFYAGIPLQAASGELLGTLCVLDNVPRRLTELQANALVILARSVTAHFEFRRQGLNDQRTADVSPVRNLRVLVVDDVAINQKVIRAILLPHQADVHLADSGEQALRLFTENRYDLVLMDRYMPGLDGFATTAQMRVIDAARGGRTIIFGASANNDPVERALFIAAGVDETVAKPIRIEELWTKLNRARVIASRSAAG